MRIYLDSALYFKSKYIVSWAVELVCTGRLKMVTLSFMVAWHIKFVPDVMLPGISPRLYKLDNFTTKELEGIVLSINIKA